MCAITALRRKYVKNEVKDAKENFEAFVPLVKPSNLDVLLRGIIHLRANNTLTKQHD